MTRREWLLVVLGIGFVAAGLLFGLEAQPAWAWTWTASVAFGVVVLALVALAVGGAKIRGALDASADAPPVSWAPGDSFAAPSPERSDRTPELSSDELASVIERAGERARHRETVEDGLEVVRPPLRETLGEALVAGGQSREAVKATLADGSWTDDRLAASVLEPSIDPPDRPLRERIRAWLFPERVARDRSRRAMSAVAEAADEALPSVPGQSAPRTKPVLQPRLEELRRGADGRLQRAVDPAATVRGPRPPRPRLASEDADSGDESGTDFPEGDGPNGKREVADR
ncbi:hypothetical protein C477_06146 [Haloterrigena salina JCM 13891]|uniref:Uncharacterized protein n=1 Tax=Haloterrigena salina JCM 13891 TaxID=1227488 RepID=M0CBU0_9EURY|nr:hypothetical protein [Haloterrigena salina]ELZ20756.1 hypothetical protein C477_06146 [Haloterrigena salina JCM 13891]